MIEFILGKVLYKEGKKLVIEKDGIGLSLEVPEKSEFEGKIKVFTYLSIKNEEIKLYGFKTREERDFFLKLISVSGIGVKHALEMLSTFSVEELIEAIENRDISLLSSISGIGKKTAQRIIFELHGKLDFYENEILEDLINALVSLGYEKKQATKVAIEVIKKEKNLEEALKLSLQKLSEKR